MTVTLKPDPNPEPPSRAGTLALVGGALALDFANTQSGLGTDLHKNHLRLPEHVAMWIEHAGALSATEARQLRAEIGARPATAADLLARASALRAAIFAVGSAVAAGAPPSDTALADLARLHVRFLERAELAVEDDRACWRWTAASAPVAAALGPVALSAVSLFTEADFRRIKQCGGHACGGLFLDTTKNNGRRWCEMEVCGNRAKQKRLAERKRAG